MLLATSTFTTRANSHTEAVRPHSPRFDIAISAVMIGLPKDCVALRPEKQRREFWTAMAATASSVISKYISLYHVQAMALLDFVPLS